MSRPFVRESKQEPELDEEIKGAIMKQVREGPAKPWTVVSRVANDQWEREEVREALRQLTLGGEITPTADGDLRESTTEA